MSEQLRIFIARETSALSLGAGEVAAAIQAEAGARGEKLEMIRPGSRGLTWAEPMVEVEVAGERIAYGPVAPGDVAGLFDASFLRGGEHPLALGPTKDIPYLKNQTRLTFARVGLVRPDSLEDYIAEGGFAGLKKALEMKPGDIIEEVTRSGLRGRGGAGFPAGIKWQTVLDTGGPGEIGQKYIVCNADEGDSGTFSDRMLMEGDPLTLIEGMIIAGLAVGADQGFIYLRSEYPLAHKVLQKALAIARAAGWLGDDIRGSGKAFDIEIRLGAGSYVCGEETALLESLEGKRGQVRAKPPLPAISGLWGKPTVVNNVVTLASVPGILAEGGDKYEEYGVGRSRGTLAFQLAGNVKCGGLVEVPFGLTLRQLIEDFAGGTASGRPLRAVQVGGPLGAYFPDSLLDTPLDYEAFVEAGGLLGHGGIVVFDDTVQMAEQAKFAFEFCAIESCGKCTPCRIGSVRGAEVIARLQANEDRAANLLLIDDLCEVMEAGSLCAMGGLTPLPVKSALRYFPDDFGEAAE
jgi:formate dehydrogenase iron-sulfur subunit